MESEHRRKRKSIGRPSSSSSSSISNTHLYFSARSLFLFFIFLFVIISFSNRFYLIAPPYNYFRFRRSSSFSLLYSSSSSSSATRSVLDSFNPTKTFLSSSLTIQHRIILPDYLLLIVAGKDTYRNQNLRCVYRHPTILGDDDDALFQPVISTDLYDELRSIVRCPIPQANYSLDAVDLRRRGETVHRIRNHEESPATTTTYSWDNLAYEAYLDEDSVIVFAKGLKLRPHKIHDPTRIRCHFGSENVDFSGEFAVATNAISAAQEVFRCPLPRGISEGENGIRVTVSNSFRNPTGRPVPSIAVIQTRNRTTSPEKKMKKHVLCACTMLWNQASFLKEWIMYHAWLGVERWFIYDNNSDDEISDVVAALNRRRFNVTRKPWPWTKSQEAGFSHCAVAAKPECKWVGFFDVDEFFNLKNKSQNSLKSLVSKFSDENNNVGEIRTACRSFGPSGLTARPRRGVTVGYTCRLRRNERHKSIVRPEMVEQSLMNVVHHFAMKEEVRYVELKDHDEGVINHYKYQVWESFKDKFRRRVSTYVADWGDRRNTGSKDRAPGLGTVAREPEDWRERFCEVWDTKLRDFVLANFVDPKTMTLPWET